MTHSSGSSGEKQRVREEYDLENLCGYDSIYSLPADDTRQIRYNEIVKAVYNNEAKFQIRKVTNSTHDSKKKQELINKAAREKALAHIQDPPEAAREAPDLPYSS